MKKSIVMETKIGRITLVESNGVIVKVSFNPEDYQEEETPLLLEATRQVESYLEGDLEVFDFPYQTQGSIFQEKVWAVLKTIPYGQKWSYKEVAIKAGNPKAARAVGMANNRNPLSIIIPCHRVIGANGSLVGYGGGLAIKESLLNIENHKNRRGLF